MNGPKKKPKDVTRAGWATLQCIRDTGRWKAGPGRWVVFDRLLKTGYVVWEQVGPTSFRYKLTPKALKALGVEGPAPQPGSAADQQPTETVPCSTG